MGYNVKCTRDGDGYTLSYGKGAKKVTARLDWMATDKGWRWTVGGNPSKPFKTKTEAVADFAAHAARVYGGDATAAAVPANTPVATNEPTGGMANTRPNAVDASPSAGTFSCCPPAATSPRITHERTSHDRRTDQRQGESRVRLRNQAAAETHRHG